MKLITKSLIFLALALCAAVADLDIIAFFWLGLSGAYTVAHDIVTKLGGEA